MLPALIQRFVEQVGGSRAPLAEHLAESDRARLGEGPATLRAIARKMSARRRKFIRDPAKSNPRIAITDDDGRNRRPLNLPHTRWLGDLDCAVAPSLQPRDGDGAPF